jgi:hypothetical protein
VATIIHAVSPELTDGAVPSAHKLVLDSAKKDIMSSKYFFILMYVVMFDDICCLGN